MFRLWRHRRQCRKLAHKCTHSGLASYIDGSAESSISDLSHTSLISVDLELTGLDCIENRIIAIGWTLLDHGRIRFGSNQHILIKTQQSVGKSATIHGLMDSDIAGGVSLERGLEALFEAARERVWLFHHAPLDVAFLQKACVSWTGVRPPIVALDTLQMELELRKRRDQPALQGDLQLGKLRSRYKLPQYTAHNALIDACATAELLLAIASRMDPSGPLRLKPYLRYF